MEMREAAKPFFIVVYSPHLLIRFQNVRDSTKIKIDAMVCLGPQETVILQNVAFRQVTFVIRIRSTRKHIPAPIPKANQHPGGHRFSFMLSQVDNSIPSGTKLVQHFFVILSLMDEELLALT